MRPSDGIYDIVVLTTKNPIRRSNREQVDHFAWAAIDAGRPNTPRRSESFILRPVRRYGTLWRRKIDEEVVQFGPPWWHDRVDEAD
jgi:hypothetical protein